MGIRGEQEEEEEVKKTRKRPRSNILVRVSFNFLGFFFLICLLNSIGFISLLGLNSNRNTTQSFLSFELS